MQKRFDIHVHTFPDRIAKKTVAQLGEFGDVQPSFDGTRAGLIDAMRRAGIAGALNCPVATNPGQVDSINEWAAEQNRWPVLSLGSIHPDSDDSEAALGAVRARGLPGIKMHPEYQEVSLDDPRFRRIAAICRDLDLLLLLHAGADIGFQPPYRSTPMTVRSLVRDLPGLKLVAAHFGSWQMWDDVEKHLLGEDVHLDLAFTLQCIPPDRLADMIRRHGAERVLFGTDAPWRDQTEDVHLFDAVPLSDAERDSILWRNAAGLLGI